MTIYSALRGVLLADPMLAGLVGGSRIYFLQAPAPTSTAFQADIIQYPSSGDMDRTLEGSAPPWTRRISFECRHSVYGDENSGAHQIGDHVLRILNNYVGTSGGEKIESCYVVSDVPDVDENSAIKRRIIDFRVMHRPG